MSRFSVVTPLNMLCVVALVDAGCRVYDTELVQRSLSVALPVAGNLATADAVSVADNVDAGVAAAVIPRARALPACGNGRVDDAERCDVAIPQGEPGACPDGCPQRGCLTGHLEGTRCGTRCETSEITEVAPGDGCCPSGATPASDSDCSATCGNGQIDGNETCDPPERCLLESACKTELTCMTARYTGSRDTCSARCELLPIVACTPGDGCCPPGCTQKDDSDCPVGDRKPATSAASSAAAGAAARAAAAGASGVSAGAPADPPSCSGDTCQLEPSAQRCVEVHAAGPCQACDCAYCSDQFLKCEDLSSETDKSACQDLISCATKNRCSGLDCYCGATNVSACAGGFANGPCVWEVRAVAGAFDVINIFLEASSGDGPLPYAANALACRGQHCKRACGL